MRISQLRYRRVLKMIEAILRIILILAKIIEELWR